jgi:two-component system, OmpR family, sensor histidine kinase AdeS
MMRLAFASARQNPAPTPRLKWLPQSLRLRIALSAVAISVSAALVAAFAPDVVYALRDRLFLSSLAPADQLAYRQMVDAMGTCSPSVYAFKIDHGFEAWQLNYGWALGLLVAATAAVGAWFAFASAGRIARPIEALTAGARRVAAGDRAPPPPPGPGAPGEIVALHQDFAAMTTALAAADNDIRMRSAAIAHELRTPLTVIRGRLVGVETGLFEVDERLIASLLRQVALVDQLVADLGLLAMPQGQGMVLDRQSTDIGALAADVVETLGPLAKNAGCRLVLDHQQTLAPVDGGRIERAISNLVENAIRYAPASTITLAVRRQGAEVLVRVSDTGGGWPVADPATLLVAFVRGETSRSRATGGAGLGLAIVAAVVEAHGGTLQLTTDTGGGAAVEIRLRAD